jgi:hypothetical protein
MRSKIWSIVNWGILLVVFLVAGWMVWSSQSGGYSEVKDTSFVPEECVDVEELDGFEYEACYDAYSETIFLKVSRSKGDYDVEGLEIYFVDLVSQSHVLEDVPGAGENRAYKILAKKNPKSINIRLDVAGILVGAVCQPKGIFIDYCPTGTSGSGVNVSISPISGIGFTDFVEIEDVSGFDSDIVSMDLVEKEEAWESVCKSNWDCGEWGACEDSVQRRNCRDLNNCGIPTGFPASTRGCDGSCFENWECEWDACKDGFSVPVCSDLNDCGTSYDVPKKLPCEERGSCLPDISCDEWTKCDVDYNFLDLVGYDEISQIDGTRTRVCVDKKGCIAVQKEEEVCSVSVDIYSERFEKCGENYIGVYDSLDNSTLAILKQGGEDNPYFNIYFNEQDSVYCDFCFDGVMNGDEEDVDCGGSCRECEVLVYEEKSWWEFVFGFD